MMYCYMNVVTKVGIKSCRGARECVSFVHDVCSYPAAILYLSRHMQYTMMHGWLVIAIFVTFYVDPLNSKFLKFRRFKTSLYNHHSPKPGHIPAQGVK